MLTQSDTEKGNWEGSETEKEEEGQKQRNAGGNPDRETGE